MNKTEKQLLELIEVWLTKFPCSEYFDEPCCILELINEKEILDFIEEKYKKRETGI